ncbi:hypothetical protein Theba_2737 (plasmid) [Mesotoga prima MesG1.Ag.4.2]|jgi:hypothetical protein|uniref:Uncharacterized protein n=1 Tax=Mesotoga prima MesG1.Ag.4.2 TaxID=660470 RepID=I2F8S7_9BACT|nr:hypothetical protein [Mesotoga prima]AFK08330.1 hypothetical protein Theba_2737 [Mesotoga prima MesG1.Ag.4.2]
MSMYKKIKRVISFSPKTWGRLDGLSNRMDTPISTLVNMGIAWWMDYNELFKRSPEVIAKLMKMKEEINGEKQE